MELQNINEIRIGSREVATMLDITRHANLIRKIESIDNIMLNSKLSSDKYWVLSSYIDTTGKSCKEYLLTKEGCELLAHKLTSNKGVLFTVKYMDKFKTMEQALSKMNVPSYMVEDPIDRAKRWIKEEEQRKALLLANIEQEKVIQELEPKGVFYDTVTNSNNWSDMGEVSKILNKGMGRNKIYSFLRDKGVLDRNNKPYQSYVDRGYFKLVVTTYERKLSNGTNETKTSSKLVISPKGVDYLNKILP